MNRITPRRNKRELNGLLGDMNIKLDQAQLDQATKAVYILAGAIILSAIIKNRNQ